MSGLPGDRRRRSLIRPPVRPDAARPATRAILIGVTLCVAGLAALGFMMQRADVRALHDLSKENIMWSAAQLQTELERFLRALGAYAAGAPDAGAGDVADRFDILWSRVALFRSGRVGRRLSGYDRRGAVEALFAAMRAEETRAMAVASPEEALALLEAFKPHSLALRRLSSDVIKGEEARGAMIRGDLRSSQSLALAMTIGALSLAGLLVTLIWAEAHNLRRRAERTARLAAAAAAANEAKSRFFAMMSHELRTPMNGVLGLLALAKQPGLSAPQLRLIEQAEAAGARMTSMLTDLLDYAAIQDDKLSLSPAPFSPRALAAAIEAEFMPEARRRDILFHVDCMDRLPDRLHCDADRFRQCVGNLLRYLLETAGVGETRVSLDHVGDEIVASLSFVYDEEGGAAWVPDMVLGERRGDGVAADAFGPTLARSLIASLGGRIEVSPLYEGRTTIAVFAPAAETGPVADAVVLAARTATMGAICRTVLGAGGYRVFDWPAGADGRFAAGATFEDAESDAVCAILHETGSAIDEPAFLLDLRSRFPEARLIALGAPSGLELYDAHAPSPLEVNALRALIDRNPGYEPGAESAGRTGRERRQGGDASAAPGSSPHG